MLSSQILLRSIAVFTRKISLLVVIAQLAGCGSGNPEAAVQSLTNDSVGPTPNTGSPYVHFEGTWQGTVIPDGTMTSSPAIAVVNGWGEFRLLTTDAQFVGFPRRTASELGGELTGLRSPGTTWSDGTRVSSFTISGSIAEDNFIDATYTGSVGSGMLAIAWEPSTNSTDISAIAGIWALFDDFRNIVATFEVNVIDDWSATITGAYSNGCTFSGTSESWTSFNSYDISPAQISSCPLIAGVDVNGGYSGSAVRLDVADDGTDELALVIALSNNDNQLTYFLYKP